MACEELIGTWRLVSYRTVRADGTIRYPFGNRARGYLIYTPEGRMVVTIMPQRRRAAAAPPVDAIADPFSVSSWLSWRRLVRLARYAVSATRYISYSGRYTVSGNTVIHHVEVSQMLGLLDTDQVRVFEIKDDSLLLTAQTPALRQDFEWERVPAEAARNTPNVSLDAALPAHEAA
ncbi:MAG TPA: lipocalin-like domain-containing protein [Chloroflexota bacterium]|nr:lipocalin-like domain-containing protein [Chloroflexota bacterium]